MQTTVIQLSFKDYKTLSQNYLGPSNCKDNVFNGMLHRDLAKLVQAQSHS
jgi:hypothetical protein